MSFNTTLVQLKVVGLERCCCRSSTSFNTTLVQLKAGLPVVVDGAVHLFQYHSGPIKSPAPDFDEEAFANSFNTTLVQLKAADQPELREFLLERFQYHSGPIKSRPTNSYQFPRLAPFQYHSGPIKRQKVRRLWGLWGR